MVPGKPFCWHSLLDYHIGRWWKINWRAAWKTPILQCLPHPLNFLNFSLQQCLLRVAKVLVSSVNSGSLLLSPNPQTAWELHGPFLRSLSLSAAFFLEEIQLYLSLIPCKLPKHLSKWLIQESHQELSFFPSKCKQTSKHTYIYI